MFANSINRFQKSTELDAELLQALQQVAHNPRIVINVFDIQRLILEDFATYSVFAGWIVTDRGKKYLRIYSH